jgi:hypothetical protein
MKKQQVQASVMKTCCVSGGVREDTIDEDMIDRLHLLVFVLF